MTGFSGSLTVLRKQRFEPAHFQPPSGSSVFCDWLTIYQQHLGDDSLVPTLNGGRIIKLRRPEGPLRRHFSFTDENGELYEDLEMEFTTAASFDFEGSFDTHIQVKSEGGRVSLSGNIGRFERPDNVFGYSVAECIVLANKLMLRLGLPAFTGRPIPQARASRPTLLRLRNRTAASMLGRIRR